MRIFSFMVVVALGACGSKKEEPPGCEPAVENAIKLSRDAIPDDKTAAKAREVSLARCNEDKWSAETRDCLVKAKVAGDVAKCGTPAERKKLEEALAAAMMGSDPGPGSDVGSGSAGSGSAMGSGSGSGSSTGSGSAAKGSGSAVKAGSGSGSATESGSAGSGSAAKPAAGSAAGSGSAAKPAAGSGSGSAAK